jgi:acyl-CoA thioesterase II
MGDFDRDTSVEKAGDGYRATISRDWEILGPNGGYVSAIALRAAGAAATIKRPVTFHAHYLRVARFEAVDLKVDVVHRGTRSESIRVEMFQNDKILFTGLLRTAMVCEGMEYDELKDAAAKGPGRPHPESLPHVDDKYDPLRDRMTFWKNLERRASHSDYFSADRRSEDASTEGWVRFKTQGPFSDPFVDAGRSLVLLDTCLWPSVFRRFGPTKFVAPSLDITTLFHQGAPQSDWLRYETQAPIATGGLIAGQGRTFDEAGNTLASGYSQMLCVPNPE